MGISLKTYRLRLLLSMSVVLILINLILTYSFNIGDKMGTKYTPLMDAIMMFKLESTTAHLWFEELMAGDKDENIDKVNKHLESAHWYANAMLHGGVNEEGTILPLENRSSRQRIKKIIEALGSFEALTEHRYTFSVGSKLDQEYDAFFEYFMNEANLVEIELRKTIRDELKTHTFIYYLLSIGSSGLVVFLALFLYRSEKQKHDNLHLLTQSHSTLELYKERMDLAFTGSNDGLWDWNLLDDTVYFSPRWRSMLGYDETEIVASVEAWHERIHPDDIKQTDINLKAHLCGKTRIYENMHRLRHKDGSWVWILARGKAKFDESTHQPVRFIGTHTNVTQEKNLEKDLRDLNNTLEEKVEEQVHELTKSTQMFESIFEVTKNGICLIDLDSNFLLANGAYVKMTGFSAEELSKMSRFVLSPSEEQDAFKKVLDSTIRKGFYGGYECLCLKKDGNFLETRMDVTLMPDRRSFLIITKDITQENSYKKQRHEQEEYLLQQSRMAQMGEMISMIAHQWRQPLSAISASSMSLRLDVELEKFDLKNEDQRNDFQNSIVKTLERIDQYVQSLTTTINDFRNFYKPNKETTVSLLSDPVDKALSIIKASFDSSNIEIQVNYESTKKMNMYENEMMQVILNILKNAEDNFLEKNIQNPKINIHTKDNEDESILEVCDNGGGVPQDVIDKIFNPYFSTKSEKNGTGLGLYMSKTIVESHHKGDFFVENRGDGACFVIKFYEEKSE